METSNKVVEVINVLCEKLGIAIDWTSENILPYLEQLGAHIVQYELWTSVFWIVFCLICALIFLAVALIASKYASKDNVDWDYDYVSPWVACVGYIGCATFTIAFIIVLAVQAIDIIACLTCPEKVVLDYLLKMINSGS